MSKIDFKDRVAIITGAGNGLGKSHAMELAARGAKVVINDLGGSVDGSGGSKSVAESVVAEIEAAGGEAMANGANVTNDDEVNAMVADTIGKWGRVDVLINNAGILRDKTFHKMEMADFRAVLDVHLVGTASCTHAVWPIMREQQYGRVVCTSSPSGLHGIFGQANYGAAKAGMIGFMNALHLEGAKYNIRTNLISPSARTRMTENLGVPEEILKQWTPEAISAAVVYLASEDAPSRQIVSCVGGGYAVAQMTETDGYYLPPEQQTPEGVAAHWDKISSKDDLKFYEDSSGPNINFIKKAQAYKS